MKKILSFLTICIFAMACSSQPTYTKAENALDAGREFIDGCLKGEFKKAEYFMLPDETNKRDLEKIRQLYLNTPNSEKLQYNHSSIVIDSVTDINDFTTIISYRNSYTMAPRKVKVVKKDDTWQVDFKEFYDGKL
ncbi:MAG: hypothetical protein J0I41_24075 [Filimonas sp.]|nr:hypothetical protein [Filimonas sp.]